MISQKDMLAQTIKLGVSVRWVGGVGTERTGVVLQWREGPIFKDRSEWLIEVPDGGREWVSEWILRGSIQD